MIVADAEHHVGIHRDEAAIAVVGKAAVAGDFRQRLHGHVVEAEVEHRIHHAGHRGARAGAHRDEQRIVGVAELAAGDARDVIERILHLSFKLLRIGLVVGVEMGAELGRDGEAGRHRQAEVRHLGKVRALAAEQVAHVGRAFGGAVAKGVNPLGHIGELSFFVACEASGRRFLKSLGGFLPSIQRASRNSKQQIPRRASRRRQMIEIKRRNAIFVPPGGPT